MAKYIVHHRCGHEQEHVLFGPGKNRESKLQWLEQCDCTECWKKAEREKEMNAPIEATINCNGLDTDAAGNVLAEIVLTGGTRREKERISAAGYRWMEARGGILDLLSMNRPKMAWVKMIPLDDFLNLDHPIHTELVQIASRVAAGFSEVDVAMIRETAVRKQALKKEKEAAIAAIPKPERPACYPSNREGFWNGKVYGGPGRWNYYVANKKYELTDAEYAECEAYTAAMSVYKEALRAVTK